MKAARWDEGNTVVFSVAGQTYTNQLARGVGYNAATNTTSAEMNVNGSRLVALGFYQTSRNNSAAIGTGITNIKLMRPLAPDSTAHHDSSEIVARRFKQAVRDYCTCLRWLEGANGTTDSLWSDRTGNRELSLLPGRHQSGGALSFRKH